MKTIKHGRKKLKKMLDDGKISHVDDQQNQYCEIGYATKSNLYILHRIQ
jgi:hypothetical protein